MDRQTEQFSYNDKYLINEYKKFSDGDYLLTDIGDKTFVVPYKYTIHAKDGKDAVKQFKTALLDFLNDDERKALSDTLPQTKLLRRKIIEKIEVKYNAVINAHRQLNEDKPADFSAASLEKYTYKLLALGQPMCVTPDAHEQLKVYRFLCGIEDKILDKFNTTTVKLKQSLGVKILKAEYKALKKYKPTHWKISILAGVLAISGYHVYKHINNEPEAKDNVELKSKLPEYIDFRGRVHSDQYGNLQRLNELQPEIMATLLALEGFAEKAFLEGGKNPTKGSGFTVTINDDGTLRPVKMGDKTTLEEDATNNKRYIENEFINLLGDDVGRSLSDEEIKACICAGYCWGTKGFSTSQFYKSICRDENIENKSRKISGYRTPIGLLKRGFLISQVLRGNWTAKDLLDLPIYLVKSKGYVHCCIYTLDFRYYLPCKKDKNGHYLKDKYGNDIPVVCDDDFCHNFYDDADKKVLKKLINIAEKSNLSYKCVRDFLQPDMVNTIERSTFKFQTPNDFFFTQLLKNKQKNSDKI